MSTDTKAMNGKDAEDPMESWQLPFATVQRVVRALTQFGVAVPESSEEQSAKAVKLIELLCDEAAPGKLQVQPEQQGDGMCYCEEGIICPACEQQDAVYAAHPSGDGSIIRINDGARLSVDEILAAFAARQPVGQEVVDGLLASIAVGSDGEYVSIRRWARDAAVAALRQPAGHDNSAIRLAGNMLANCAYNLAQRKHLTDSERQSLDESRKAWDAAVRAAQPAQLGLPKQIGGSGA